MHENATSYLQIFGVRNLQRLEFFIMLCMAADDECGGVDTGERREPPAEVPPAAEARESAGCSDEDAHGSATSADRDEGAGAKCSTPSSHPVGLFPFAHAPMAAVPTGKSFGRYPV